jgi:hypothetical protein
MDKDFIPGEHVTVSYPPFRPESEIVAEIGSKQYDTTTTRVPEGYGVVIKHWGGPRVELVPPKPENI